ncbi:MAG: hypothetical protein R2838_13985 [Caldilineaceae bacterium]
MKHRVRTGPNLRRLFSPLALIVVLSLLLSAAAPAAPAGEATLMPAAAAAMSEDAYTTVYGCCPMTPALR